MVYNRTGRSREETRTIKIKLGSNINADGACEVSFGNTVVLCTASIDNNLPPFLKNKDHGWVTAEYGMLPGSTHTRVRREAVGGKQSGRTQEIQRLIGRSLRAVVDLNILGPRQIIVDCDVVNADGGTRTASITGGYVALHLACLQLLKRRLLISSPIKDSIAAISCGVVDGEILLDLDYEEDSQADVDANFVITGSGNLVEVQASAEGKTFNTDHLFDMLRYAKDGILNIAKIQKQILQQRS